MFLYYIQIAFHVGFSTTYGYGENNCGDVGYPVPCTYGATTASGQPFSPDTPTAAVAAPKGVLAIPTRVYLRVGLGPCVEIIVNDKMNPRYIGTRAFDLSPGALEALGITPDKTWTGIIQSC